MRRYMIRVPRDAFGNDDELFRKLEDNGLKIDREFGSVPLDPEGSQVLVRGMVPEEKILELSDSLGIEFFPEIQIKA